MPWLPKLLVCKQKGTEGSEAGDPSYDQRAAQPGGTILEGNTSMYIHMQRPEGRASEGGHGHDEGGHKEQRGQTRGGRGPATLHWPHKGLPRAVVCPQCGFSRRALRVLSILRSRDASQSSIPLPAGPPSSLSRGPATIPFGHLEERESRAGARRTVQQHELEKLHKNKAKCVCVRVCV